MGVRYVYKGCIRRTYGPESAKFDSLDLWLLAGGCNQTSPSLQALHQAWGVLKLMSFLKLVDTQLEVYGTFLYKG